MGLASARKLAVFLPINSAGHTQGLVAIASQLRDQHNVRCVFIVAGPPHSRIVEDHGHELIELEDLAEPYWAFEAGAGEDVGKPMSAEEEEARLKRGEKKIPFRGASRWPQLMPRHRSLFNDPTSAKAGLVELIEQVLTLTIGNSEQMDRTIDSLEPDIVIADNALIQPSVLKMEKTRPWIKVWSPNPTKLLLSKLPGAIRPPPFQGVKLYTKQERERIRREEPDRWQSMLNEWAKGGIRDEALERVNEKFVDYYRDNGCHEQVARSRGFGDGWLPMIDSPHLNIYMFPAAIDYDQDDDLFEYPARWLRCDSLIRKSAGKGEASESARWLSMIEAKRRDQKLNSLVYFSLGSIASGNPGLIQRFIDFLSEDPSDRLYIVSKGVNGDKVRLNERNMLGGNYLPQTFLLQQADMAIIHGGNNSLTETLYYGKPMIVLPSFGDQPDNAQRIEDLGLGKRLSLRDCTREQLLQSIGDILGDEKLIAKAHAVGVEMRARDDLGMVSSIVMDMIENQQLTSEVAAKYGIRLD